MSDMPPLDDYEKLADWLIEDTVELLHHIIKNHTVGVLKGTHERIKEMNSMKNMDITKKPSPVEWSPAIEAEIKELERKAAHGGYLSDPLAVKVQDWGINNGHIFLHDEALEIVNIIRAALDSSIEKI